MFITPEIKEKYPHVKLGIVTVRGANNRADASSILKLMREVEESVRERYDIKAIGEVPKIKDWREAYRSFGFKPSEYRSSVEALTRRVLQGKDLPDINPLVNIYNLVSVKHTLCAGSDDLNFIEGPIRLAIADGTEPFTQLGSSETVSAKPGEVVYRDDKEVLCRAWNYRECEKSKVSETTTDATFVIEGLEHTTTSEIKQAVSELKSLIQSTCGGIVEDKILLGSSLPEYHQWDDFKTRSAKLKELREMGMEPYPHKFHPTANARDLIAKYENEAVGHSEEAEKGETPEAALAGRIVLFRAMGKNAFAHIQDQSVRIQLMFNREGTLVDDLPKDQSALKFIERMIDLGDIVGVDGHLFRTKTGELTLYVKKMKLLTKSLLPLANKYHGLQDKGTRYRKRWLDMIMHPEVGDTFRMRSQISSIVRREMAKADFLEVETPILQNIYGGAEARPFLSHLNALNQEMYMRIALEIALKKLLVGGMDRVYEMSKVFRNEGIDRTHNPEFTMLECYAAYWDYNDMMDFAEHIFEAVALEVYGTTQIGMRRDKSGKEHAIDLKRPWIRISMKDSIKKYAKIDVDTLSDDAMRKTLKEKTDLEPDQYNKAPRGKLIAYLFEELVEHHLIQPHHITDHPIETTPLCKLHRDPKERAENIVERFESFICGMEFCNAYSELNDPELQRKLLEDQAKLLEAGDDEAHPLDEEFIEAICQGMPPASGIGIGIDRLTMLITGKETIREVVFFPIMRPGE